MAEADFESRPTDEKSKFVPPPKGLAANNIGKAYRDAWSLKILPSPYNAEKSWR